MTKTLYVMRGRRNGEDRFYVGAKPLKRVGSYWNHFIGPTDIIKGARSSSCRQFLSMSGLPKSKFPRCKNVKLTIKVR